MTQSKSPRPERTYATGAVTTWLRRAALLGFAGVVAWIAVSYPSMPEAVPIHFGVSGEPDGFGDRSNIWVLAAVMTVLAAAVAWLSTKPRHLNYIAELTEENAQRVYREGERMLVWLLLPLLGVYLGLVLAVHGLSAMPLAVVSLVAMPVLTITALIRMSAASARQLNPGVTED